MNAALYIRRSTNEKLQADSLRVQEHILRTYAKDHGMKVLAVYRDSASGTSTKHRKAFLEMVETITHGAPFEAVLVRDVSRFGRFYDPDEAAFFEVLFLGHNVKTVYCEEAFGDDTTPMAGLLKSVRRVMAAEYSRDKSRLIRAGRARSTRQGFHCVGPPSYGLRRTLVTASGAYLRDLAPGEWKAISGERIKLAPGKPEEVETVRSIFRLYADEGLTATQVTAHLNDARIRSPRGTRWSIPVVLGILGNPAYIGVERYVRGGPSAGKPPELVEGRNPGMAIVGQELWDRARGRHASSVRNRPDAEIAADVRTAYERYGRIGCKMLASSPRPYCWSTVHRRFGLGVYGALELAFTEIVEAGVKQLDGLLSGSFHLQQQHNGWKIDDSLTVEFRPAFRHKGHGPERWTIAVSGIVSDLVVGFGISPQGNRTDRFFLARSSSLRAVEGGARQVDRHFVTRQELVARLGKLRCSSVPTVEEAFLAAARRPKVVVLRQLARELGWPAHAVRRTYWRLQSRGEWLPPLRNGAGRLIEVSCSGCGTRRWVRFPKALERKSDLCRKCAHRRLRRPILVRCPACGQERECRPSAVRRLSNGERTRCRACSLRRIGTPLPEANRGSIS